MGLISLGVAMGMSRSWGGWCLNQAGGWWGDWAIGQLGSFRLECRIVTILIHRWWGKAFTADSNLPQNTSEILISKARPENKLMMSSPIRKPQPTHFCQIPRLVCSKRQAIIVQIPWLVSALPCAAIPSGGNGHLLFWHRISGIITCWRSLQRWI